MKNQTLQLVQLSVDDMTKIISEAVANELQKVTDLITLRPTQNENELLSREETSKLLKVSFTTLFNWNREKVLEAKKLGKKVYYLKSEVLNKLNNVA